jgi:hypothetical protein
MAPSPWRRRKRLRAKVFLSNATDILMVLMFVSLLAFACFEAQTRQGSGTHVSHARVRPGASATPLPETPEPPRP